MRLHRGLVHLTAGGVIAHKPHQPRHILARHHDGLADTGEAVHRRFDLAQFDTVAAQLDLVIGPAQEIQPAIGAPAHQVARAIHARPPGRGAVGRHERIRQKAFRRQIRALPIAARHTVTTDIQLSGDTDGHGLLILVQHIDLGIRDGCSDIDHPLPRCRAFRRGPDRGFRGAVHVFHAGFRQFREFRHQRPRQRLTAQHQVTHLRQGAARLVIHGDHARHAGGALQMADPVAHDLRRDGIIVRCGFKPGIGAAQHLGQGFQSLKHLRHRDAVIDQAGHFRHADAAHLFDPLHRVVNGAEQPGVVEIAQEGEIKDRFQLVRLQRAKIQLEGVVHALRPLEGREGPGILLDQPGSRAQVILHRFARDLAHRVAILPQVGVQHQRDLEVIGIVPRLAQRLVIDADLARDLVDGLAQKMRQHMRPDLPGLAPCIGVARRGHPDRQFL